ncbi:MAG: hypothetical protein HZB11_03420 [Candidatus Yonathbacteria bacterium]|nr:hypothetical protein [Candidatus Yonathbacteria bacterium]
MSLFQFLDFSGLYQETSSILSTFFSWFPYWGPLFLGYLFAHQWMHYVQGRYMSRTNWILLEVKLPREIHKTPLAMEIVLNALYQSSGKMVWWDKYWKGKVKDWFSLEMVSIDGHVKFFIRTGAFYKNVIEAQLYAQYPDIEIHEVPDYTRYVDYRGKEGAWEMIGSEYTLTKPDAYPIKTYVGYGMDKEGVKEEFKIDPLTSIIEYLGSIGKDEQVWIQILVQSASKRYHKADGTMGDWKDEGKDLITKLTKRDKTAKEGNAFKMLMMTKGESEVIAAIERNIGKLGFECGIRAAYFGKKDKADFSHIKALGGILRPFTSNNLNGFKGADQTFGWDFPWEDYDKIRLTRKKIKMFEAYKQRSWFHLPRKLKPFVLTTEELATIYHFPGGVAQTPTFGRIPSRKSEAPINLPI